MGKQEKHRKPPEDNRDIFDKIGDEIGSNPIPYGFGGAAIAGGLLGRAGMRRVVGKKGKFESQKDFENFRKSAGRAGAGLGTVAGAQVLGAPLTYALASEEERAKARKYAEKKRRK
jgi:hypothetical protein